MSGIGIDQSEPAIFAAREAARDNGLSNLEFLADDVASAARRLLKASASFDLIIVDPPRTGAREVIEPIINLGATHLAVCSCDPVTLARDLRRLVDGGFFLDHVQAFDMFPHTHHLETLAWLRRSGAAEEGA
jgi:23S rRNA (uracil1939-C5)-methyltransferase